MATSCTVKRGLSVVNDFRGFVGKLVSCCANTQDTRFPAPACQGRKAAKVRKPQLQKGSDRSERRPGDACHDLTMTNFCFGA